jgi:hypothetical protein
MAPIKNCIFRPAPGTIIACPDYFVVFIESLLLWPLWKDADAALFEVLSSHLLNGLWKTSCSQVPGPGFEFVAFQIAETELRRPRNRGCFHQSAFMLSYPKHLDWVWVPPSLLLNGCRWLVFRDKTTRVRSWDFTSVANLKNAFSRSFTLPRVLMAWCLFERKWSFVLYLDFCNNWRTRHSPELKIVAGFCDKTRILGKVKHGET